MSIVVLLKKIWGQSEQRLNFGGLRKDKNLDFSFVKFSKSPFLSSDTQNQIGSKTHIFNLNADGGGGQSSSQKSIALELFWNFF